MRILTFVFLLVGVGILTWLIWKQGVGDLYEAISIAGWSICGVVVYRIVPFLLDAAGWMALFQNERFRRPSLAFLTWARWITESLNTLLPVAQVGGHMVRAVMVSRRDVPAYYAGASVIVDFTMGFSSQIVFIILGASLLAGIGVTGVQLEVVIVAVLAGCVAVVLMYILQRSGVASRLSRRFPKLTRHRVLAVFVGGAERMEQGLGEIYSNRKRLGICFVFRLLGWLAKAGETWLILFLLGLSPSFAQAIALETVSIFLMTAAFIIPGALGIREGGIVLAGGMLGIAPEQALALALIKRIREILVGIPGIATWTWQEGRSAVLKPSTGRQ